MKTDNPSDLAPDQSIDALRLHLALEAARAGFWEADVKTGRNIWSEEVWALYGLKPGSVEPSTATWQASVHPEQRASVMEKVSLAVARAEAFEAEWRVNRDDKESWLYSRGRPMFDASGQVERYIGIVIDITERKLAMQVLAQREQELHTILDNLPAMVARVDKNLRYRYVNHLYSEACNLPIDQFIGKPLEDAIGQHALDHARPYIERALRGESVTYVNLVPFADGEPHELRLSLVPDREVSGTIQGYFSIGTDLSQEQLLEAERERLRNELDKVSRQQIAQKIIIAVTHEINQPLHAAATYCETAKRMISQGYRIESSMNALTRANEELGRAGESLKNLLDSTYAIKPITQMEVLDLNQAAVGAIRCYYSNRLPEHSCVSGELAHVSLPVNMNIVAIEKVVINLLSNACKAMIGEISRCSTHCRIRVSTTQQGDMARLCVQDNGPGVSDEQRKTLFQPALSNVKAGCLGFGLSISRQLVELHGGHIWHEPTPGGGATFCFALPLAAQAGQS